MSSETALLHPASLHICTFAQLSSLNCNLSCIIFFAVGASESKITRFVLCSQRCDAHPHHLDEAPLRPYFSVPENLFSHESYIKQCLIVSIYVSNAFQSSHLCGNVSRWFYTIYLSCQRNFICRRHHVYTQQKNCALAVLRTRKLVLLVFIVPAFL